MCISVGVAISYPDEECSYKVYRATKIIDPSVQPHLSVRYRTYLCIINSNLQHVVEHPWHLLLPPSWELHESPSRLELLLVGCNMHFRISVKDKARNTLRSPPAKRADCF